MTTVVGGSSGGSSVGDYVRSVVLVVGLALVSCMWFQPLAIVSSLSSLLTSLLPFLSGLIAIILGIAFIYWLRRHAPTSSIWTTLAQIPAIERAANNRFVAIPVRVQEPDILDLEVDTRSEDEVKKYITKSRTAILNQRFATFALLNILTAGIFICYTTPTGASTSTPTPIQMTEVGSIGVKAIPIGGASTLLFGSIFYAGRSSIEVIRKNRGKLARNILLCVIVGMSTVLILVVVALGEYVTGDAVAVAIATNIITDTCIMFDETIIRFLRERIAGRPPHLPRSPQQDKTQDELREEVIRLVIVILLAILCFSAMVLIGDSITVKLFPGHQSQPTPVPTLAPIIQP
jgi:hypothetical protein